MSAASSSRRPLAGVRIIDMSRLAPGPYCTMLLADLGAEVIVVGGGRAGNPVATFSRGKHFIKLDLKAEAGQKALRKLVEKADVFVESFRPGVARRLGATETVVVYRRADCRSERVTRTSGTRITPRYIGDHHPIARGSSGMGKTPCR